MLGKTDIKEESKKSSGIKLNNVANHIYTAQSFFFLKKCLHRRFQNRTVKDGNGKPYHLYHTISAGVQWQLQTIWEYSKKKSNTNKNMQMRLTFNYLSSFSIRPIIYFFATTNLGYVFVSWYYVLWQFLPHQQTASFFIFPKANTLRLDLVSFLQYMDINHVWNKYRWVRAESRCLEDKSKELLLQEQS